MTARRLEGVHLEHAAGEILALSTATWEVHALNQSAAAVYALCGGTASRAEMAAEIRRRTGLPADEAIVDFALAELAEAGLVVLDASQPPSTITRRSLIRRLSPTSPAAAAMLPAVDTRPLPVEAIPPPPPAQSIPRDAAADTILRRPDVSDVPSSDDAIEEMLALAGVTSQDVLYDLGCGDGRIVIAAAATRGCRAVGVEIDPHRVAQARENVRTHGVADLVQIESQDLFAVDLSHATVVMLYLLPTLNVRLVPQLATMKPGARIVSQDFDIPGLVPDRVVQVYASGPRLYKSFFLFTVPLKVHDGPVPREWAQATGLSVPSLHDLYVRALATPSDIVEHLPTLRRLAADCAHVTEFGTRTAVSTTAFLQTKATVVTFDIDKRPEVAVLEQAALAAQVDFRFVHADVLTVEIEPTDLLFIDTAHVYQQCRAELERHGHQARKYIAFHDTVTFGEQGEWPNSVGIMPAIDEYFAARPEWVRAEHWTNNNGLTVYKKRG